MSAANLNMAVKDLARRLDLINVKGVASEKRLDKVEAEAAGVDILHKRIFYPQTSNLMWISPPRFFNKKNWYKVIKGRIAA